MSGTTSVPALVYGPRGVVVPSEQDVLAGVLADINAAFGNNLNVQNLETPQGQLASTLTAIIGDKNNQVLWVSQMVDPALSKGRMQDAIARIYFINRKPALSTTVDATCIGAVTTTIPAGALARATDGTIYRCVNPTVIPFTGQSVTQFEATTPGPIPCAPGNLNEIYQGVPGWDSITNVAAGVIGSNVENATDFELRRSASVAQNGQGMIQSIRGSVLSVPGVTDAYAIDNPTGSAVTVGGVALAAHSLYVSVSGGSNNDVARAIFNKRPPGTTMVGNVTVPTPDWSYAPPYPTYNITFNRPSPVPIYVAVALTGNPLIPADAAAQIQAAVVAAFTGGDGSTRARIGGTVYASRFYAAVASLGAWASQIVSISIGTSSGTATADTVTVNINQIPTIVPTNVGLVIL